MITRLLNMFHNDESGQDLIEYGLITALIGVALVGSMGPLASGISNEFSKVVAQLK